MTYWMRVFGIAGLAVLCLSIVAPARAELAIKIDTAQVLQPIGQWEATVPVEYPEDYPDPARVAEALERSVDELGINRLRVGLFAGATENTDRSFQRWKSGEIGYKEFRTLRYVTRNDNDDPFTIDWNGFDFANLDWRIDEGVLPLKARLEARGERLFINLNYVAFTDQSGARGPGTYIHTDPEEYAELVLATYQHMQDRYGFVPDSWEVILEPDLVAQWNRDPMLIGRAMVAAAARLRAAGFTPAFVAPSVTDMSHAVPYLNAALRVPGAREVLAEVSYHRYRGGAQNVQQIASVAARLKRPTAMLEWWFGNATDGVLYQDLTMGNNSAWAGRALFGHFEPAPEGLRMRDEVRYLSLYQAFIREGAHRLRAVASGRDARPLAARNADGSVTLVARAGGPDHVAITGLPPGDYRAYHATAEGCAQAVPVTRAANGTLGYEMPAAGVLAITSYVPPPSVYDSTEMSSRCRVK